MEPNLLILAAIGLVAGFVGSLLGIGGGFFVIPMLTLALGLPMQTAIGTSLVAVVATSSIASASYLKSGLTNLKLAMLLEVATTVGAVGGAFIAVALSQTALGVLFALVMVYVAYSMGKRPVEAEENPAAEAAQTGWMCRYFDRGLRCDVSYRVKRIPLGMSLSGLAGLLSGLLGIGGGVVSSGHLLEGCTNTACELGHMTIMAGGRQCHCPNQGCFEAYAGGWAIAERAQEAVRADAGAGKTLIALAGGIEHISAITISQAYAKGDTLAHRLVSETAFYLAAGTVAIINAFNPCLLVFGGGVIQGMPGYVSLLEPIVRTKALQTPAKNLRIKISELGGKAGVIGASALARDYISL